MKKHLIIFCLILFSSCASVKIYTEEDKFTKENEVGLKFYQPKPFLLVEHNPAKDVNIKTSIIYLPDLSSPRYVKVKNGWGSANATVGFANGVMNSYGAISDSKGPETITGLASAVTSFGGAALSLAQVDEIGENIKAGITGNEGEQSGGDEATIKLWEIQAEKLDLVIGEKISSGSNQRSELGLSKLRGHNEADEKERIQIIKELKELLSLISVPTLAKTTEIVTNLTKNAKRVKVLDLIDTPPRVGEIKTTMTISRQLEEIAKALNKKEAKVLKYWELFEIIHENDTYSFKKISLPGKQQVEEDKK